MVLRRSCVFCRARKIRCSGESICNACEKRNLSCVYSPEARKGRPKQKGTTLQPPPNSDTHPNNGGESLLLSSSRTSVGDASHSPESAADSTLNDIVGDELERRFNVYYITRSESCTNLFQNSIVAHRWDVEQFQTSPLSPIKPPLSYDGLLSFMASEMVGILPLRFSYLGAQQPDTPNQSFFLSSLAADTTLTMFDSIAIDLDPLVVLGKHPVLQLVDVWFSAHPLSPLVSKTLLTAAIQDDTVDKALLGIILADACEIQPVTNGPDGGVLNDPQKLCQFALLQLKHRALSLDHPLVLSTVQALFLIGWRELCLGHARRTTCLAGYACRLIASLYTFWQNDSDRVCKRKLNGVDVGVVEQELVQNIYWLCLATTTWAFIQSDQPFTLLTPETTPDFPCLDETTSAIIRLDRASGNISTLQSQVQAMRCLWPLSHITSTVAHIYTLYLNTPAEDKSGKSVPWQKQHLHQLHQLFQPCFDRSVLASRMHRILLLAIELVTSQVAIMSSRSFLLNAYHSIAIHMLFSGDKVSQERLMISPSTIDSFCQSASALLAITQQNSPQPTTLMPTQVNRGIEGSNMMLYGLDTCSRALSYIYTRHERGSIEERNTISMRETQLVDIAGQLYQTCKGDTVSRLGPALLPVKKRFKRARIAFELLNSSAIPQSRLSGQMESNPTSNWAPANELLMDPGITIDHLTSQSLNSSSLPAMVPNPSLAFPEDPTEVLDPGFFINGPVAPSLLGFPGLAKMNMQLHDYLFQGESDPNQDMLGVSTRLQHHDCSSCLIRATSNSAGSPGVFIKGALYCCCSSIKLPPVEAICCNRRLCFLSQAPHTIAALAITPSGTPTPTPMAVSREEEPEEKPEDEFADAEGLEREVEDEEQFVVAAVSFPLVVRFASPAYPTSILPVATSNEFPYGQITSLPLLIGVPQQ
ncbi:hypothetical protein ASPCADRAFT_518998 [Aspergillus carbonarius ITEM 5010]|uniref:Zn(2)-C6 fungal-type domain-containing protein n=1 Tax=Aspergillus carbonarius (strain ITEM 5010) TaxID=602072 RepID=A0A1R3R8M3_ASPC5|nr:hypothetical protein ASPCADRAFT_518998 [Aspergillus carbonarius ITEM 5010]